MADTERLIASLTPIPSQSNLDVTPKKRTVALPGTPSIIIPPGETLPAYTITSSDGTYTTAPESKASSSNRRTVQHTPSRLAGLPFPRSIRESRPQSCVDALKAERGLTALDNK